MKQEVDNLNVHYSASIDAHIYIESEQQLTHTASDKQRYTQLWYSYVYQLQCSFENTII